ncbi:OLC1v1002183C2 [Oldenlandia corymbosa var. corymbosa]|uniref:OLC1v1002183C2 n=1 Tax=Oldenlandia corymbosa var. corymbosa TaxID=529605 RepID=A0AAV1D9J1_OLDCO|nr:OLC1v1002183C2 [Oldenlandia corymbosa var. corymbosa]
MGSSWFPISLFLVLPLFCNSVFGNKQIESVQTARDGILEAINWAQGMTTKFYSEDDDGITSSNELINIVAIGDCLKLYEDSEHLLSRLVSSSVNFSRDDAVTWLSAAMASHRSCLDGLEDKGLKYETESARNLSNLLREALSSVKQQRHFGNSRSYGIPRITAQDQFWGVLASWDAAKWKADIVVAQDGSGNHRSINEAVSALAKMGRNRPGRAIIYVKSGIYHEKVEIERNLENVMFVGDGMDRTVVTGYGVSGNGFWARDITFENTAGPEKHQAVALRVASDLSVFYRCSFKGYQDTLLVHSLRQFYRDCHIYGTQDFIFGDASAVFQNCDIFVRKPMDHQSNLITAQGRDNPEQNTGISILNSRVSPASDFRPVISRFKSYLGRPWKKYSRTVFIKTDLDGLVDPQGWKEWSGDFALSTLYYAEFMNRGYGAFTVNRVKWPGYHVLRDYGEASQFSVKNFIQGHYWIPATGVPYWADV